MYFSGITKEREVSTRGLRTVFQEVFAVNVFGTAVTADAFLPLLKKSKAGPRIVNMSSGLGSIGTVILPDWMHRQLQLLVSTSHKSRDKLSLSFYSCGIHRVKSTLVLFSNYAVNVHCDADATFKPVVAPLIRGTIHYAT
jgi:hypothetical protein